MSWTWQNISATYSIWFIFFINTLIIIQRVSKELSWETVINMDKNVRTRTHKGNYTSWKSLSVWDQLMWETKWGATSALHRGADGKASLKLFWELTSRESYSVNVHFRINETWMQISAGMNLCTGAKCIPQWCRILECDRPGFQCSLFVLPVCAISS